MQRIYVKRNRAQSFRNIAEVFPITYDKAVERIETYPYVGEVNYRLFGLEFKGKKHYIDDCSIDIGIIDLQDESKTNTLKQKTKKYFEVIVITAPNKERLSELERKINLEGTFIS